MKRADVRRSGNGHPEDQAGAEAAEEKGEGQETEESRKVSAPQKDSNERFEWARAKPRYWRIALGIVIVVLKLVQFATSGLFEFANSETSAYRSGAFLGDLIMFALAGWLIYTGRKPARAKIPKD